MSSDRVPHLPLAAFLAVLIMVGMPIIARLQPKPADDPWLKSLPPMYPTGGRVLFEGRPVAGGIVVFHTTVRTLVPQPGGSRVREMDAMATTDKDGWFDMRAFRSAPGVVAGPHYVKIEQMVPTGRMLPMTDMYPDARPDLPAEQQPATGAAAAMPEPPRDLAAVPAPHGGSRYPVHPGDPLGVPEMVNRLPERFANWQTSGLVVNVVPGSSNVFEIRLTAEPPPGVAVELPSEETDESASEPASDEATAGQSP